MMYKRDIGNKIYQQMMRHFYCENGFLQEEVVGTRNYNMQQSYQFKEKVGLYEEFAEDIRSVLFTGIKKGVFTTAKFDSKEGELTLAWVLESDDDVLNWLRPIPESSTPPITTGTSMSRILLWRQNISSIWLKSSRRRC